MFGISPLIATFPFPPKGMGRALVQRPCARGDGGVRRLWPLPAMLCGVLVGSALQLWQPSCGPMWVYGSVLAAMGVVGACVLCYAHRCAGAGWVRTLRGGAGGGPGGVGGHAAWAAVAAFALCGLRASGFAGRACPGDGGQDVRITAVVAAMPSAPRPGCACACRWSLPSGRMPRPMRAAPRPRAPGHGAPGASVD